jgi:hypothetical protein
MHMAKARSKQVKVEEDIPLGFFIEAMLKELPLKQVVECTAKLCKCDEQMALEVVYHIQTNGAQLPKGTL